MLRHEMKFKRHAKMGETTIVTVWGESLVKMGVLYGKEKYKIYKMQEKELVYLM